MNTTSADPSVHTSQKFYHNRVSKTNTSLVDWAFHHNLAKILMMNYIFTEQLTALVDVTFMLHGNPKVY